MTPKQAMNRCVFVKASKLKDRASSAIFSRKETNTEIKKEKHENDSFDDFFEFEDDISNMKSSSEQFMESSSSFIEMEELDESQEEPFVCMEEID